MGEVTTSILAVGDIILLDLGDGDTGAIVFTGLGDFATCIPRVTNDDGSVVGRSI